MRELATATLFQFPNTTEQQQTFIAAIKEEVLSGIIDVKELIVQKKMILDTLEAIFESTDIKKHLIDEIEKYGKEGAGFGGYKITKEQRRSYDYSQTGDIFINKYQQEADIAGNQLKARQKFLQMLSKPMADPETGELVYPAAVSITEYLKVSKEKTIH